MAKILHFYVTNQKICKPPCSYQVHHGYSVLESRCNSAKIMGQNIIQRTEHTATTLLNSEFFLSIINVIFIENFFSFNFEHTPTNQIWSYSLFRVLFLPFSKAIKLLFDENQASKSGQNRLTSCPKVAYHPQRTCKF